MKKVGWVLHMANALVNSVGVSVALSLSLFVWRTLYPLSDLAVVALAPLAAFLFVGSFSNSKAANLASVKCAVKGSSPLVWLIRGRIRALLGALALIFVAVPVLGGHALTATNLEFLLIALLSFVVSMLFADAEVKLLNHLRRPFARIAAISLATLIGMLLFAPLLAWIDWNFTPKPAAIRSADFWEAISLGFSHLPERRGWVAELLAAFYALEYAKLWIAVQEEAPKWLTVLYSIDAGLICFVAARAAAVVMSMVQVKKGSFDE